MSADSPVDVGEVALDTSPNMDLSSSMTDMVVADYVKKHGLSTKPASAPQLPAKLENKGINSTGTPVPKGAKAKMPLAPVIFNEPYARLLLKSHVEALGRLHDEVVAAAERTRDARDSSPEQKQQALSKLESLPYTNVSTAASTSIDTSVTMLVPFFRSLLAYRNTVLKAKQREMRRDITIGRGSETAMNASISKIDMMKIPDQWEIAAIRMLEGEAGRLPGQMTNTQPTFLPLRIFAPPRVGKSALGLLVASLAKRMGFKMLYSVSPDKVQPIKEAMKKLDVLGWTTLGGGSDRSRHGTVRFSAVKVEDVLKKNNCTPLPNSFDMMYYSSDELTDAWRVGAYLAEWRSSEQVILHFRDEAQSLAKTISNPMAPCHTRFVPPPPLLSYLREFYGNMFGMSCNITATQFPTLLEPMWGFIGSVDQGIDAGISLRDLPDADKLSKRIGTFGLPELVPALEPVISEGYVGVKKIEQWKYTPSQQDGETLVDPYKVHLTSGTKSVFDMEGGFKYAGKVRAAKSKAGDVLQGEGSEGVKEAGPEAVDKEKEKLEEGKKARKLQEIKDKLETLGFEQLRKTRSAERSFKTAKATLEKERKRLEEEIAKKSTDSKKKQLQEKNREYEQAEINEAEFAANQTQLEILDAGGEGLELDGDIYDPDYAQTALEWSAKKQVQNVLLERDILYIHAHFDDFLDASPLQAETRDPDQADKTASIVPTYIGALNQQSVNAGMASFVRTFGKRALDKGMSCAFLLFTSAVRNQDGFGGAQGTSTGTAGKIAVSSSTATGTTTFAKVGSTDEKMSVVLAINHPTKFQVKDEDKEMYQYIVQRMAESGQTTTRKSSRASRKDVGDFDASMESKSLQELEQEAKSMQQPIFVIRLASDAKEAFNFVKHDLKAAEPEWSNDIDKFAILGYALSFNSVPVHRPLPSIPSPPLPFSKPGSTCLRPA